MVHSPAIAAVAVRRGAGHCVIRPDSITSHRSILEPFLKRFYSILD